MLPALFLLAAAQTLPADTAVEEPVAYAIDVTLDERRRLLRATERIRFRNLAGVELPALYLHVFPNAFRSPGTAYGREHAWLPWSSNPLDWIPWGARRGYLAVQSVRLDARDAGFTMDGTVMTIPLPSPLTPGASLTLDIAFEVRLPVLQLALGFRGPSYAVALWYPKLAVPDTNGWRGEREPGEEAFYADCGSYEVRITAPREMVVAATGERADSVEHGDGTITRRWRAGHVRYFAWVADRRYRVTRFTWNGVSVEYLHAGREDRSLAGGLTAIRQALDHYGGRYGPYPHPTLVIAETPALGTGVGGISYSQLVMLPAALRHGAIPGMPYPGVLAHEIAHQWWGMTVGVRDDTDDWLNEGLAEFAAWDLDRGRAEGNAARGFRRAEYLNQAGLGFDRKIVQPESAFADMGSREVALYAKAPSVLRMLQYLVGPDTLDGVLRAYASRYRYRTARTADFAALADSLSGRDLTWFFQEWLDGAGTCDYAVDRVATAAKPDGGYRSVITLRRNGGIVMPVELEVTLADGRVLRRAWPGREPSYDLVIDSAPPLRRVVLDPDRRLLETNRFNNYFPRQVRSSFVPHLADDDAYRVLHLPVGYYDDGLEIGMLIAGWRTPRLIPPIWVQPQQLAVAAGGYNLATETAVARLVYSSPLGVLGRRASWSVSAVRGGRREAAELSARALTGPHLYRAPFHAFKASLELERRLATTAQFDRGTVVSMELGYAGRGLVTDFYPIRGGTVAFDVEGGWKGLGSDWTFLRAAARAEFYHLVAGGAKVALNGFAGAIVAGAAPRQKALRLAGEGNFRSPPSDTTAGAHLAALNGELRVPVGTGTLLEVAAFVSLAGYWASGPQAVGGLRHEAGVGLRLFDNANYAVQLDLPVWSAGAGATRLGVSRLSLRVGRPFRGPGS